MPSSICLFFLVWWCVRQRDMKQRQLVDRRQTPPHPIRGVGMHGGVEEAPHLVSDCRFGKQSADSCGRYPSTKRRDSYLCYSDIVRANFFVAPFSLTRTPACVGSGRRLLVACAGPGVTCTSSIYVSLFARGTSAPTPAPASTPITTLSSLCVVCLFARL